MKRILVFLGLMILTARGIAQNQAPDMEFFINFSGISNSPPYPGPWGQADYYRTMLLPFRPAYTNWFDISIGLQPAPEDAWILEKQADGSFSTVAEVTNPVEVFTDGFPPWPLLTTNQVHSLVEGNWYVELDFADGCYIGNLAPDYAFAIGPTATVVFPPVTGDVTPDGFTVIASSKRTAKFVFDGSHCTDPYYLPMRYSWSGWAGDSASGTPIFTSTNLMATNAFAPGLYTILLHADDIIADGRPFYFYLVVNTPGQAVEPIISNIQSLPIPKSQERVLTDILSSAETLFNKGDYGQGCFELEFFEYLARKSHFDGGMTSYLLQSTQEIIDAVNAH